MQHIFKAFAKHKKSNRPLKYQHAATYLSQWASYPSWPQLFNKSDSSTCFNNMLKIIQNLQYKLYFSLNNLRVQNFRSTWKLKIWKFFTYNDTDLLTWPAKCQDQFQFFHTILFSSQEHVCNKQANNWMDEQIRATPIMLPDRMVTKQVSLKARSKMSLHRK